MKKLVMVIIALMLAFSVISALDDPTSGAPSLAQYYPEGTVVYAAIRTDEGYFNQLDELWQAISEPAAEFGVPAFTLRQASALITPGGADAVLSWLGDAASFGVTGLEPDGSVADESIFFVFEIEDKAAARDFLLQTGELEVIADGDVVVLQDSFGDAVIEISDEVMVLAAAESDTSTIGAEPSLLESAAYRETLAEMPEDSYNILFYTDMNALAPFVATDMEVGFDLGIDNLGALAVGATIRDGVTFMVDVAQTYTDPNAVPGNVPRIDPAFAQLIPADVSLVTHATDLTALYTSVTDLARTAAESTGEPDPSEQIEAVFGLIGIDLQADVLSWTTGDYALFARSDIMPIAERALYGELAVSENVDWGMAFAATDPAAAQNLATELFTLIDQVAGEPTDEFSISTETIGGVEARVISINAPVDTPLMPGIAVSDTISFDFVLAANDEVFVFASRRFAANLLNGGARLADNVTYQEASRYFLPEPTSIWYTDGEGFLLGNGILPVGVLVVLGPAIGEVFENIIASLDSERPTPTPSPTPTPTPLPSAEEITEQLRPLELAIAQWRSSSVTATINENNTALIRFAMTLNL